MDSVEIGWYVWYSSTVYWHLLLESNLHLYVINILFIFKQGIFI